MKYLVMLTALILSSCKGVDLASGEEYYSSSSAVSSSHQISSSYTADIPVIEVNKVILSEYSMCSECTYAISLIGFDDDGDLTIRNVGNNDIRQLTIDAVLYDSEGSRLTTYSESPLEVGDNGIAYSGIYGGSIEYISIMAASWYGVDGEKRILDLSSNNLTLR